MQRSAQHLFRCQDYAVALSSSTHALNKRSTRQYLVARSCNNKDNVTVLREDCSAASANASDASNDTTNINAGAPSNAVNGRQVEVIAELILKDSSIMTNQDHKQNQDGQQNQGGQNPGQQGGQQNQKPGQQSQTPGQDKPGQQGGNASPQNQK